MHPLSNKNIRAGITLMFLAFLPLSGNLAQAAGHHAQKEDAARKQPAITTEKDQVDLAVTVYNSNIALVRDVRQIHLPSGLFPLHFEDVAASINPATVHFRSLVDPAKLNVIQQNYEFDVLDPQKLLQKYVGKEVTLVRAEKDAGSTRWVETKAVLLANNNGPVWKIGNEIVTGMPADSYRFPDLPENLYTRPTLVNNSGVTYSNAKLQLVAGQLNRVEPPIARAKAYAGALETNAAAQPQFGQEAFSEYHLYTLGRCTSIQNNESKQISLLSGSGVPVEKY